MNKNELLMPFLDSSESFTNGFEIGQVWENMSSGQHFERKLVHTVNKNQLALMCDYFGYDYFLDFREGDEWAYFTAAPIDISSAIKPSL